MNSTEVEILEKEKLELKGQMKQLIDAGQDLLNENSKMSDEIRKLMLEQVGTNNKIKDIYLLLASEIRGNGGLLTDSEDAGGMLDNIRMLVVAALHDRESFSRENEFLRRMIKKFQQKR